MRTTLDLDDKLLEAARRRAADQGTTLTAFVEKALASALAPRPRGAAGYRLRWKVHHGRLRPGIDIADRDSLFDAMDGRK
jgi:hypothetical protein